MVSDFTVLNSQKPKYECNILCLRRKQISLLNVINSVRIVIQVTCTYFLLFGLLEYHKTPSTTVELCINTADLSIYLNHVVYFLDKQNPTFQCICSFHIHSNNFWSEGGNIMSQMEKKKQLRHFILYLV